MFESIIGASVGFHKIDYTWRDMALYALAVGADENDLMYTYEKDMKALPSFGVLPYFGAINNAKFRKKVVPGDKLRLECELIKRKGPVGVGKATATVDGKVAVTAELPFMIG